MLLPIPTGVAHLPARRALALSLLAALLVAPTAALSGGAEASEPRRPTVGQDAPPASPGPAALREAATERVRSFYEAAGWRPVWDDASKAALAAALADRSRHGLDLVEFLESRDRARSIANDEVAHTEAALRYAQALAHGLVEPRTLHEVYTLPRPQIDLEAELADAIAQGTLAEWLGTLPPRDDEYARLSRAYLQFRAERQDDTGPRIEPGVLRVGDSDSRVPAIARQLIEGEYLSARPAPAAGSPEAEAATIYTAEIADAVERLQRDYGIAADRVVGPDTLAVLNLGPGDRARAIAVALERRRWMPRSAPATRIDVNTAASRLHYYRNGVLADTRRVIVGKPGTETPPLQSPIYRLVANPTWTVPKSIQHGELAHVGAAYLRRNNMRLVNGWIVQGPGEGNALGLVKFDMHNDHAIYLHDTSAPELFARSQRHRSHGCVRVEDALGFARMLAEDQGIADRWREAQSGSEQSFVDLANPIPVRLLYRNVFVDPAGEIVFRTDPYGWNVPVAKALGFADRREARLRSDDIDIAP